jgi:hypothetical protein
VATALNGRWFGFGPDAEFVTALTFAPARTADYRIQVIPGPMAEKRLLPLTYAMQVEELKVELLVNQQLTRKDPSYPRRGGPHKVHIVKLQAGKNYQIDLMSLAFDAYLFLEDADGGLAAQDNDSAGKLNARIVFRPTKSGTYRIVATTFKSGPGAGNFGPYSLRVVENPHAQPSFRRPLRFGSEIPDIPK